MSLPLPSKTDGILNVVTNRQALYYNPKFEIRGWYRFCSGGVIAGVSGKYRRHAYNDGAKRHTLDKALLQCDIPVTPIPTFSSYEILRNQVAGHSHFDLPREYLYDYILEQVLRKATYGTGGTDMWAGNGYASKTFVLGDRKHTSKTVCVDGFARYLEELQEQGVTRVVRMTDVDGAHGGVCTSWLATIREENAEEYLEGRLVRVNAHVDYLREYKKAIAPALTAEEQREITENDIIVNYW